MGLSELILNLIFPPRCVFCEEVRKKKDTGAFCISCADELPYTSDGGRQEGGYFGFCVSPFYYEGDVRKSVRRYKFDGAEGYCEPYGKILSDFIASQPEVEFDILTWVPISEERLEERGYNQAESLAQRVADNLGASAADTLRKPFDTAPQSEIPKRQERLDNVIGAYEVINPSTVRGKRVLILDDVITTGATLNECAKTLLEAGAESVICATLARTPIDGEYSIART
ncbi:MAG: ComF family protein [Oscillospiraceae bacterium]|nr:ComF family protein [Oscillospiraceae bacterium]